MIGPPSEHESLDLMRAFMDITDPLKRAEVLALARKFAESAQRIGKVAAPPTRPPLPDA